MIRVTAQVFGRLRLTWLERQTVCWGNEVHELATSSVAAWGEARPNSLRPRGAARAAPTRKGLERSACKLIGVLGLLVVACGGASAGGTEPKPEPGTESEPGAARGPADTCPAGPLASYCAENACPASPEEVAIVCQHPGGPAQTTRGATACGGTLVEIDYGTHATTWYFDSQGALTGVSLEGDTASPCSDGRGPSIGRTYGASCAVADLGTPLCSGGSGGGALGGSGGTGGMSGCALGLGGSGGAPGAPGSVQAWTARSDLTEATTCTAPPVSDFELVDQCGCGELVCPDSQSCIQVARPAPNAIGGPGSDFNGCFRLCENDGDCESPEVCVGNLYGLMVCKQVACQRDSDCTADPCGTCVQGYFVGHAGLILADPSSSHCKYPGICATNSCAACSASDVNWHQCN